MPEINSKIWPSEYKKCLNLADSQGNNNRKLDSSDEARAAAVSFKKENTEDKYQSFLRYLDGYGFKMEDYRKMQDRVVTKEEKVTALNSKKIKIPNVCEKMNLSCISDFQMIEELGIKFKCEIETK